MLKYLTQTRNREHYMNVPLSLLFLLPVVLLSPANSIADASTGELFGYQIGTQFISESDALVCPFMKSDLRATNPVKPKDIQEVCIYVTPITRTILRISGITKTSSGIEAIDMAMEYQDIIDAKYRDWPSSFGTTGSETDNNLIVNFFVEFGNDYGLALRGEMKTSRLSIELVTGIEELNEMHIRELDEFKLLDKEKTRGL